MARITVGLCRVKLNPKSEFEKYIILDNDEIITLLNKDMYVLNIKKPLPPDIKIEVNSSFSFNLFL